MFPFLQRSSLILGEDSLRRLEQAHVLVVGAGGVGSYAIEALCRAGIGSLTIVDGDDIELSNINRQLYALHSTLGVPKAKAAAMRCADINPAASVRAVCEVYGEQTADRILPKNCDYVVDAIDSVKSKLHLILRAHDLGVPIISALGTGNKLHPEQLQIARLSQTHTCPLARVLRRELKRYGLADTQVVYSPEPPLNAFVSDPGAPGRHAPGSLSFVPPCAGMIMAGVVIRNLAGMHY